MNLILLDATEVDDSGAATVSDARAAHITGVLKAAVGETVRAGIVDGPAGTATVAELADGRVRLQCVWHTATPAQPRVDLLLALPRPKVMRRLWAQLAALGVRRILLTNAERVERNYFDTHVLEERVYRPLLIEGLQQARDTRLPVVSIHRQLKVLVEDRLDSLCGTGLRLAADPRGHRPVADAAREHHGRQVLLAVGPEGGWNDFELTLLQSRGFEIATIGLRTLRTDTACVALVAIVHSVVGGRT